MFVFFGSTGPEPRLDAHPGPRRARMRRRAHALVEKGTTVAQTRRLRPYRPPEHNNGLLQRDVLWSGVPLPPFTQVQGLYSTSTQGVYLHKYYEGRECSLV